MISAGPVLSASDTDQSSIQSESLEITLSVGETDVLKLNSKPIHINFLSAVLMDMQITSDLNVKLHLAPNAPMGIVSDTKRVLNDLGIEPVLEYGAVSINN